VPKFKKYEHHGRDVWVREDLQGQHRDHCLCFTCERFEPGWSVRGVFRCLRAKILYLFCIVFGMTTPVYECPKWVPIGYSIGAWRGWGVPEAVRLESPTKDVRSVLVQGWSKQIAMDPED